MFYTTVSSKGFEKVSPNQNITMDKKNSTVYARLSFVEHIFMPSMNNFRGSEIQEKISNKLLAFDLILDAILYATVLVLIKLTKFAVALRFL